MTAQPAVEAGARGRIVAAAVELFAAQGFDATSVNEIAMRAGVAKGGLYHHFGSKDELLFEVYRELIDRQLAGMRSIQASGLPAAEALHALIVDLVETTTDKVAEAKVFSREGHRLTDANQRRVRRARRAMHDAVLELVRDAQARGEFEAVSSPEMVTFTLFGVINELPVWYQPGGKKRPADIAEELSRLLLAALTPAHPLAKGSLT